MNDDPTPPAGDGRGDFFSVDRRAWSHVCRLGMNASVAYLVLARGTGGDNRTTKWSVNAVEKYTGISRSRAAGAITELERAKVLLRDPASKPDRPKYKIVPAHEIPGCEGYPPPALNPEQQRVLDGLGGDWTLVPKRVEYQPSGGWGRWGTGSPRRVADELVDLGRAARSQNGMHYRAIRYDTEAAAKPNWIWLPNALIDGAGGEIPPVELVRQTGSAATLRLLVDLYGAQNLDEDGGVHPRRIREQYTRHRVGERGPYVVWGFVPDGFHTWRDVPFTMPHFAHAAGDKDKLATASKEFWACWNRLRDLGLVEIVARLVDADTAEGEVIHPMALDGTGLEVEREVTSAARWAALSMITQGQHDWAVGQGVVALVPVLRHIEGVQMVGIARLRYRPRTSRTLAFAAREAKWREVIARLDNISDDPARTRLGTSR